MKQEVLDDFDQEEKKGLFWLLREIKYYELIDRYKVTISLFLIGLILLGFGVFLYKDDLLIDSSKIEVLETPTEAENSQKDLIVEISGGVEKPGVYKLKDGSRVEDLLILAGGLSVDADRNWVERVINRAAKLVDGQKIYIPRVGEQTLGESAKNQGDIKVYQGLPEEDVRGLVNINTASQKTLEGLPGIGPIYAQNIIEHRPYSSIEDLLSKGVLKKAVYEKIKDKITVF